MTAVGRSKIRRESRSVTTFVLREIVQLLAFVVYDIQPKNVYAVGKIRKFLMKKDTKQYIFGLVGYPGKLTADGSLPCILLSALTHPRGCKPLLGYSVGKLSSAVKLLRGHQMPRYPPDRWEDYTPLGVPVKGTRLLPIRLPIPL
ncbi:hypothetical protein T265_12621, partial [Opisthorchis viverrini]